MIADYWICRTGQITYSWPGEAAWPAWFADSWIVGGQLLTLGDTEPVGLELRRQPMLVEGVPLVVEDPVQGSQVGRIRIEPSFHVPG